MAKLELNIEACKSCNFCVHVCPKGVLRLGDAVNLKGYRYVEVVNEDACIGCMMCANMCPDVVFEVYK